MGSELFNLIDHSLLLTGLIFVKLAVTAIDCSFAHVSKAFGLKFIQSLKHRHSGMFLAGTQ